MDQSLSTPHRMWRGKQSQGQVGNTGCNCQYIKGRKIEIDLREKHKILILLPVNYVYEVQALLGPSSYRF